MSVSMTVTDVEILDLFRKNREEGIRALFVRYYRPLVLYADELIDDFTISEDIVQEFFVRLWQDDYLERLLPKALSSYLFTSIRNACISYTRSKFGKVCKVELAGIDIPEVCAEGMSDYIVERVSEAIQKLPTQTGAVCREVLLNDKKYQEAADLLHISVNTLKTLLKNGLKMLREELKDEKYFLFYIFSIKKS